jgi:hypothetical protein
MNLSEAKKRFIDSSDMRHGEVNPKEYIAEQTKRPKHSKNLILHWYTNYIERHRAQPLQIWKHQSRYHSPVRQALNRPMI